MFRFSHDRSTIPGFEIEGHPQIFSDRILLTPPAPGNQRSALWTLQTSRYAEWNIELPFRTSGSERPGGSFHIWYTQKSLGTSTLYSSKPFDGLALVIDSFGGQVGNSLFIS